jgi:hypothetical protein
VFHFIRWFSRSEARLIVDNACGRSGLVAFLCFIPVVCLMGIEKLRKRYAWEIRKGAHYLAVPATLALCWHTNLLATVMLVTLGVYAADSIYRYSYDTHKVKTSVFQRCGNGTQLTFKNPEVRRRPTPPSLLPFPSAPITHPLTRKSGPRRAGTRTLPAMSTSWCPGSASPSGTPSPCTRPLR